MAGAQAGLCARCLLAAALRHPAGSGPSGLPNPGDWIGSYRVVRLLGEGGMGMVYLAEQEQPIARQVAVKIIKLGMDTRAVLARFQSEQQALALMEHPNIAQVYEAGLSDNGRPFFVMEYVPGIPITEYCDRNRLRTRLRLELFLQVVSGMQHAHQKGVVHRDLKPSNILVMERDGEAVPKIIDFGLAKATEKAHAEETVFTEAGVMVGTPEYMSPEQASASGLDVDTRTDIYSLGVLLYELLVGEVPFDSKYLRREGYDEIRRIIREDEPPAPASRLDSLGPRAAEIAGCRDTDAGGLRKQVRGDLDWITMTAMAKDRDRRYASASELAADIVRHLRDEPVMASPPSASYRLGKFIRKNRGPVTALAAVFVSLVLGLSASTVLYFRAERQRQEAETQRAEAVRQRSEAERQRAAAEDQRAEARRQGARAESQRNLAEQAREAADQQRKEAESQHAEAERQRAVADQQSAEARRKGAEAIAERAAAEKQREVADQQSAEARRKGAEAIAERAAAEKQREVAERQSYAANLVAADLHIRSNEISEARRRLSQCPAALRGWEWRYLLWKTDTSIATLPGHGNAGETKPALGFSRDATRLFRTAGNTVEWWSAAGFKPLAASADLGSILAADGHGARVLSRSGRNGDSGPRVYDAASGKVLASLGADVDVTCAAFDATGRRVVVGGRDGSMAMWDAASGQALAKMAGHKGGVWALAISADGERIVSGGEDAMVRIWDAASGQAMYAAAGHGGAVRAAAFSADRRWIVSGSADKSARIWDAATGRALHTLNGQECGVQAVAISPDAGTIATASCATLRLWFAESGKLAATLPGEWRAAIAAIAFSPDNAQVAAVGASGEVKVWNALTYGGGILRRASADVGRVAIGPNGERLALYQTKTQSIEVWDAHMKPAWNWHDGNAPSPEGTPALAFSPDGSRLAAGWPDGAVRIWNAATGQPAGDAGKFPAAVSWLAFTADGARLMVGTADRGVSVWDAGKAGANPLKLTLAGAPAAIVSAAYSPDRKRIVGGQVSGEIAVWDAGSGQCLAVLKGHSAAVGALAFSPDGSRIISGAADKTLRVWDAATYDPLLVMGDRDETIASVSFSPDGTRLYSVSTEGTVRIWETRRAVDSDKGGAK
jgi:WD40 repeat protein/serine/threonine protein kinase